jgi:hypothetical protein
MPSFWRRIITEAHRRSVWKVLGVYLVGSWLAYQVVLGLHDGLGLPSWVPAMAVVLFVIGLPIVVATAIVQEGPPGMASTPRPATGPAPGSATGPAGDAVPGPGPERRVEPVGEHDGPPRFLTWRRSLLAGALAFTLLGLGTAGFMGMRHLGIGPVGTLVARGVLDPAEPVVLADFSGGDGAEVEPPGLPVDHVIRLGPGARTDPTGGLEALLGGRHWWVLVRPDAHVARAREDTTDGVAVERAVRHALGTRQVGRP